VTPNKPGTPGAPSLPARERAHAFLEKWLPLSGGLEDVLTAEMEVAEDAGYGRAVKEIGEYICKKCGIRQYDDGPEEPDINF
jgi:hypothetical protein